jgi:c-di-AMP phosphodiesterase-like protein
MLDRMNLYRPVIYGLLVFSALMAGAAYFFVGIQMFLILGALWVLMALWALLCCVRITRDTERQLMALRESLFGAQRDSVAEFPMATMILRENGEVLWCNDQCRRHVLEGEDAFGKNISQLMPQVDLQGEMPPEGQNITVRGRMYNLYFVRTDRQAEPVYVLYFIDDHDLKTYAKEYFDSRPWVLLMVIDNFSELFLDAKENERSKTMGEIEHIIETFVEENCGLLKKLEKDRYIAVIEDRYMRRVEASRFQILDQIRSITAGDRIPATMSIGVGSKEGSLHESEALARQALDMALGRGGDQAAVKLRDGYEFFGGVSKGVEKRNKVRTRIVANAITEIVQTSENILVMGHRFADLDCVGAAVGLCAGLRNMGKSPRIVLDQGRSLAQPLVRKMQKAGLGGLFITPAEALESLTADSLLFVVDTHVKTLLESPEVYAGCRNIVVIDHHRKMVDHIDNAIIFFHEPYASSTCEMVAELDQYLGEKQRVSSVEAEAMLAGIMLDTKNFTLRTGVRTFEAAAFLRRMGADTIEVRKLFTSSMEAYQKKTQLVASAQVYRGCAVAYTTIQMEDMRVVASQAADELLNISGVDASFILFASGTGVNISARSMGAVNVQIIMEALGGGGHLTMAAAQIPEITMDQGRQRLEEAIDQYFENTTAPSAAGAGQN